LTRKNPFGQLAEDYSWWVISIGLEGHSQTANAAQGGLFGFEGVWFSKPLGL
jgi:hypothetical protein